MRCSSDLQRQQSDIRKIWTKTNLSLQDVDMLGNDSEASSISLRRKFMGKTREGAAGGHTSLSGGEDSFQQLDEVDELDETTQEVRRGRSLDSLLGSPDKDAKIEAERTSSMSSLTILNRTPHKAYWAEQQNRLPLPLIELMESEVLEILTKALSSYRSGIGWNHFMTKQLQRNIEELRKRRNAKVRISAK
ncbi:cation channel sperm-associated protein subunit zeta isoform X2 [Echinops telfairi]|uniref:Cation channel sperm-associated protein subunit zeta isoform X2 n=1 Tax=Echinops telfairi TaxID=9371 RepID=A0ABM0J325_ECHTE|nr:cation channel sperm-associated protein subunit zeta isoform X2 [Echinops telfairi]